MSERIAVISGASAGIGKALALAFGAQGFQIATLSRSQKALAELAADLEAVGGQLRIAEVGDIGLRADLNAFADRVKAAFSSVDVLIHNAGVFLPGAIHQEEEGAFDIQMRTNVESAYHLTRALFDRVVAAKGYIFTICSTASIMGYPNGGSYAISKHALLGLTRTLREECKPLGVRVSAILPGATETRSWAGAELPEGRLMAPADVAAAVLAAYQLSPRTVVEEILLRPQLGDLP